MSIKIGDNNKIKNSNIVENANIKVEVKEKPKNGLWKQIFVNVMSNFIWKVLGILFSVGIFIALCMLANNH